MVILMYMVLDFEPGRDARVDNVERNAALLGSPVLFRYHFPDGQERHIQGTTALVIDQQKKPRA
jgi:hypothetical protein